MFSLSANEAIKVYFDTTKEFTDSDIILEFNMFTSVRMSGS